MAPHSDAISIAAAWTLVAAIALVLLLMVFNAIPMDEPEIDVDNLEDELSKIHIVDTHHRPIEAIGVDIDLNRSTGDVHIWQWPPGNPTSEEQRRAVGARFVAEHEFRKDPENGTWRVSNLLGNTITVRDDERGNWQYGTWPTEAAKRPPVDDNTATITARTVWGPLGEDTEITIRDENGHRIVDGVMLMDGLRTGATMRAVLDGGLVVYATGWCHAPIKAHTYLKPTVAEAISAWNRTARGATMKATEWSGAYADIISLDGSVYLMPAYRFTNDDGQEETVLAIEPRIVRIHPARPLTVDENEPVVV